MATNDVAGLKNIVKQFSKAAKPLHRRFSKRGEVRVDGNSNFKLHHDLQGHVNDLSQVEIVDVGIPQKPLDFCKRAIEVGHPRSVAIQYASLES